jgi:hypothetical protein
MSLAARGVAMGVLEIEPGAAADAIAGHCSEALFRSIRNY